MSARRSRRIGFALAALIVGVGLLLAVGRLPRRLICEETWDAPTYVLLDGGDRVFDEAVAWYRRDPTVRFLFVSRHRERIARLGIVPSFDEQVDKQLRARQVPKDSVEIIPGDARTPWDGARLLRPWLERHPTAKVEVFTWRLASANERAILDHELPVELARQVRVYGLPDRQLDESGWWHHRHSLKCVFGAGLAYVFDRLMGPPTEEPYECDPDHLVTSPP
jgi:hypothetical protein